MHARLGNTASERRRADFLHESQRRGLLLPIHDVIALHLDQTHPWVLPGSVVHSVLQIPKPRRDGRGVKLLDSGILVRRGRRLATDRDPILGLGVLNGDLHLLVLLQVLEFSGVLVRQEQDVGPASPSDGHGAAHGSDTLTVGVQHTDFLTVDQLVQLFPLYVFGR